MQAMMVNYLHITSNLHGDQFMTLEPKNIKSYYKLTMHNVPKAVIDFYTALSERNSKNLRDALADNFTHHSSIGKIDSPEQFVKMVSGFGGFVEVSKVFSEGRFVALEMIYNMTYPSIASIPQCEIIELENGKIKSTRAYNDPKDFENS